MKRVIEKGNLAFNHHYHICDLCKRWNGEFTEDDKRVCKYNKDNKGLNIGFIKDHMENYKCKYYKRDTEYHTCKLMAKNIGHYSGNGVRNEVSYKRGKFVIKKNNN